MRASHDRAKEKRRTGRHRQGGPPGVCHGLAAMQDEKDKMGLGEQALSAVFPKWLPDRQPEDYKHHVRALIPDDEGGG